MKHKIFNHHQKEFNPKYNSHLNSNRYISLKNGKHVMAWIILVIMAIVVALAIAAAGGIWMYRNANEQARQNVAVKVQREEKPKGVAYDQASLNKRSDHQVAKDMVIRYARQDGFINKINYDSKKDVAKVYLNKSTVNAINYASKAKKPQQTKLTKSVHTGVRVDNVLSNQAVKVANASHDGYFTFTFANASAYQAPNTKTGNYNV